MSIISEALVEDYFLYREDKGVKQTPNSKKQTIFAIQSLNQFISQYYPTLNLRDLRQIHMRRFIDYLRNEKELKVTTITTRLFQLRGFFIFCQDNDLMDKDPLVTIETPVIPVERERCITEEEWKKLLTSVKESCNNNSDLHRVARDVTMMMFLAYTACSLEEICSILVDDIDVNKGVVQFCGTNKTERRLVSLPDELLNSIKDYLDNHRQTYFRAQSANPSALFQASKATFQRTIRIFTEQYLSKRFTVEDIRASRISSLLKLSSSVWAVSEFLGIHDLTRLRRYIPDVKQDVSREVEEIKQYSTLFSESECYYLKSYQKRKANRNLRKI